MVLGHLHPRESGEKEEKMKKMLIVVASATLMFLFVFTPSGAFAQDGEDDDGSMEAPVASGSQLSVCLTAIEVERVRLSRADATCDANALRRVRIACAGQETTALAHFQYLMEMCGMPVPAGATLRDVFEQIDCSEPVDPPPSWQRRPGCDQTTATPAPHATRQRTRQRYLCLDSARPIERHGRTIRCDCPEGLREVRVDYRTVRQELGQPNGVIAVSCANPNPVAESIRREELTAVIERITALERVCTDDDGHFDAQAPNQPLLCRTIWMLVERVSANGASIADLDRRVTDLEPRVEHLEETAVDHESRISALEDASSDVDLGHFRIGLGIRAPIRFETGVASAYGVLTLEWAPRFTEALGLYARATLGYGTYADEPGQTGAVPLGESGIWGVAAGLELEPMESFTLDVGLAFDASLIEGQRGNAFGTYRWHNLGPEVRLRFNPHENFFVEGSLGATWSRTAVEANNVLTDVDGFGLVLGASVGASF